VKRVWLVWTSALGLLASAAACASRPPNPFFGDEAYLHFGLDTNAEANALIQTYAEQTEPVSLRLDGQHFTALGFMSRSGRATRVRVVTVRGIQLALDPEPATPVHASTDYALLDAPIPNTHDADGDGFDEIFVERRTAEATCLLVYRVRDVGFVDPVPTPVRLFAQDFCPTAIADLDRDGRAELIVDAELGGFEGETPRVRVPLWAFDHRYELRAKPEALALHVAAERAARQAQLADARRRLDTPAAQRLAIELAALACLLGQSPREQVLAFDNALAGLVLGASEQRAALAARMTIFTTWNVRTPSASVTALERAGTSRGPHE
jgi:hypothetical protein